MERYSSYLPASGKSAIALNADISQHLGDGRDKVLVDDTDESMDGSLKTVGITGLCQKLLGFGRIILGFQVLTFGKSTNRVAGIELVSRFHKAESQTLSNGLTVDGIRDGLPDFDIGKRRIGISAVRDQKPGAA